MRISFGGGGTDVSPYPEERGGAVLSATIDKYAYCSLAARDDELVNVTSLDYDLVARYPLNDKLEYDGKLDLVKAAVKTMVVKDGVNPSPQANVTKNARTVQEKSLLDEVYGGSL